MGGENKAAWEGIPICHISKAVLAAWGWGGEKGKMPTAPPRLAAQCSVQRPGLAPIEQRFGGHLWQRARSPWWHLGCLGKLLPTKGLESHLWGLFGSDQLQEGLSWFLFWNWLCLPMLSYWFSSCLHCFFYYYIVNYFGDSGQTEGWVEMCKLTSIVHSLRVMILWFKTWILLFWGVEVFPGMAPWLDVSLFLKKKTNLFSAKTRQVALESLRLAFSSKTLFDFLLERRLTLTDSLEKCLKKGGSPQIWTMF